MMTSKNVPLHPDGNAACPPRRRCARAALASVVLAGGLAVLLVWLAPAGPTRSSPTPELAVGAAQLAGSAYGARYPRGQLQADLRTLLHAVEFILAPVPIIPTDSVRSAV